MALKSQFQNMLNEYLSNELMSEELKKRDYILSRVTWDKNWLSGTDGTHNPIIVPFKAARASSVRYGKYTALTNNGGVATAGVTQLQTIRGKIDKAKELHGSLIFNQRDLMRHGKLSEQNFLKLLPDELDDMMTYMKNIVSTSFLTGRVFAKVTDITNAATGKLVVTRPDRFQIGQLVEIFDGTTGVYSDNAGVGGSVGAPVFVIAIDVSTKTVTFSATPGGAAINFGANVAVGYAFHNHDAYLGGADLSFANLRNILLSAANGGDATYLGQTKATYPYLQAYNFSGAAITSTNIIQKLFDARVEMATYSKAQPTEFVMSFRNLGACMKIIEIQKGAFNVVPNSQKVSQFGWMEIMVGGPEGNPLKLVGVNECDDDVIIGMNFDAMKFHTDGGIRKVVSPDGLEYYTVRNEDGYQYVCDIDLFGELVINKPHRMGIIHSVPTL